MPKRPLPSPPLVSIVIPVMNEAEGLARLFKALDPVVARLDGKVEIVCIDDGSSDDTHAILLAERARRGGMTVIELSRNFGKEAALTAGLAAATGRTVVPFDADLQDPPDLIPELVDKWREGYDVVVARRRNRSAESPVKRFTAWAFYKTHNRLAEVPIPENVGDFRLLDRQVVEVLKTLPERRRFMKGLFSWAGFRTATIDYTRDERQTGKSSWSYWKLWNFALEGITSFSSAPLRLWFYIGGTIAFLALIYAVFIVAKTLISGVDVPGYASLITIVLFLGGVQLLLLGLLGEYIGRIYMEVKGRPLYVIRSINGERPEQGVS